MILWSNLLSAPLTVVLYMLSSVIQEAHASRYKDSMHLEAFDKAVKNYRQRVQYKNPVSESHGLAQADASSCSQDNELSSEHIHSQGNSDTENSKKSVSESHTEDTDAQKSLKTLLGHVLQQAKILHKCSLYYVDGGNILDIQGGGSSEAIANRVSDVLRRQLDDVAVSGSIGKATREEVLQDSDARHVSDVFGT